MNKRTYITLSLIMQSILYAQGGLLGGDNDGSPIAYILNVETRQATPITGLPATGSVFSVDLSSTGIGILAGNSLAFTVDSATSSATPINGVQSTGFFDTAAISDNGTKGLLGGSSGGVPLAYVVNSATNSASLISGISPLAVNIGAVAINANGTLGLLGGGEIGGHGPFAYIYDITNNITTPISLSGLVGSGRSVSAAIDQNGQYGLLGIQSDEQAAFIINVGSATATAITFPIPMGTIVGVINGPGTIGLLGGEARVSNDSKVFKVDIPSGVLTEIPIVSGGLGDINVAIDSLGVRGLVSGSFASSSPFAYTLDLTTNTAIPIAGLPATSDRIVAAIQASGKAGLLGGNAGTAPVAFLLPDLINTPSLAIQLNLGTVTNGSIRSVDLGGLLPFLNSIPTTGLSGNNLRLANYLNANASDTASFFIPSELNGTLTSALESVAPTRNAIPLFALNNNFFALRQSITQRACDARQTNSEQTQLEELSLLASGYDDCCYTRVCPYSTLWGQIIGLDAYQVRQDQTPSFHPLSIGAVLGYDYLVTPNLRIGSSLAYMYTHLHQNHHQGHDTINQEYISLFGLWNTNSVYANAAVYFGLFQIDRVRNIHLDEFDFRATSDSFGYQLDPHLELGYDYRFCNCDYTIEPFVMFDWIHNWQSSYKEKGTGPFLFKQHNLHASVFRTETGLRFYQKFHFCSWNLILEENGSYIYRKPYSLGNVTGALIGAPGTFTMLTFTEAQNLGSAGLVFLFEPTCSRYPVGTVAYKAEFGSGYQAHEVLLGTEWSF